MKSSLSRKRKIFSKIEIKDFTARKTTNTIFYKMADELKERIEKTTGLNNYDNLFEILTVVNLSKRAEINPLWEGIAVLFHFRNVIAHGRSLSLVLKPSMMGLNGLDETLSSWGRVFTTSGYKKAEDYFIKNSLIDKDLVEHASEEKKESPYDLFFNNKVSDHFWALTKEFLLRLINSMPEDEKECFSEVIPF